MSAARILVVDDEADIRSLLREILSEEGYEVEVAADAGQARSLRARAAPDLVLLDIWMPDVDGITLLREWSETTQDGCPVVMMSGHGTVETAVEATRLGAFDFVEKPLSLAKLLRTVERALDAGRRRRGNGRLLASGVAAPVGKSRPMQQLRAELQQYASLATPLLLIGEPGSGREAFARFLHDSGPQAARPFITVVASALREADAELALLGRDGAATPGLIEQAAGGTLFINDVEELPAAAQRVLLGVLESGRFTRLGGTEPMPLSARFVASARPGVETRAGAAPDSLRRELLARLNGLIARVPALREYAEDVPELLLRGGAEEIRLEEIEAELGGQASAAEPLVKQDLLALSLREAREQFERAYLQQQLLLCNGKVGQLAKRVGMERTHLYRKLRSLGVDFRSVGDDEG